MAVFNSYITGNGDGLIGIGSRDRPALTSDNSLTFYNNLVKGDVEFHSPTDRTFFVYTESDNNQVMNYHFDYNQIGGLIKFPVNHPDCPSGANDICLAPQISGPESGVHFNVQPLSSNQGVNSGYLAGSEINGFTLPIVDIEGYQRNLDGGNDIGPYELHW